MKGPVDIVSVGCPKAKILHKYMVGMLVMHITLSDFWHGAEEWKSRGEADID